MKGFFTHDGIRGIAQKEIKCSHYLSIGSALGYILSKGMSKRPLVLVARDTRTTSEMFMNSLISGLCSVGVNVCDLGLMPTPAVPLLTRLREADASVVVTSSYASYEVNGLKIFSGLGYKFPATMIEEIKRLAIENPEEIELADVSDIGTVTHDNDASDEYVNYVRNLLSDDLAGMKIAIDCGNGSAYKTAEKIFGRFSSRCLLLNSAPDGTNMNESLGTTGLAALSKVVVEQNCNLGIAFNGTANRCIAIDEKGSLVNGDKLLGIFADDMNKKGLLRDHAVVSNMLCGLGLTKFYENNDIRLITSQVGSFNVLNKMLEEDVNLAGEQSGHICFRDLSPASDGQITAIELIKIMRESKKKLSELAGQFDNFPQILVNVRIADKFTGALENDDEIKTAIGKINGILGSNGRIFVRESETEPVIRIMLEGKRFDVIKQHALEIEDLIRQKYQG